MKNSFCTTHDRSYGIIFRRMKCFSKLLLFLFLSHGIKTSSQVQSPCSFPVSSLSWLSETLRSVNSKLGDCQAIGTNFQSSQTLVLGRKPFQCVQRVSDTAAIAVQLQDKNFWPYLKSAFDLYEPLLRKSAAGKCHEDFIYLPVALTAINPAYACNQLSGIFAMTPWVAGRQGLRVDSTIDERKSGDLAIHAAFNQLFIWNQAFNQPDLVIIAWTESPARANELLQTAEWREKLTDHEKSIINYFDYVVMQFKQNVIPNQLHTCFDILGQYAPIRPSKDLSIRSLCDFFHFNLKEIENMNPVFVGNIIPHDYLKVPFYIPQQAAIQFDAKQDSIILFAARNIAPQSTKRMHVVKKGESLGAIASKYKISTSKLKETNKLRSNKISVGQKLVITTQKEQAFAIEREIEEEEEKAPTVSVSRKKEHNEFSVYIVREGDSLWKISRKFKVTEKQIKHWNQCGEHLQVGQKIKIKKK
jgi:membrane-bound lytic murein transglycosylase D